MNLITLDSALRVDCGGRRVEVPSITLDGFRVRPQLAHLVNSLGLREDSGEAAVLQRGLDYVAARATEVMYPELRAARFFPTIGEVPLGARTFTFAVMDRQGVARRVTGNGDDLPNAGITLSEVTSAIGSYGAQYGWTTEEMRAFDYARGSGRGPALALDTARGDQAQLMIARKIDNVCAFGDPEDSRIRGVLNDSNVTVSTAAINWNSATYAELLSEMIALANEPVTASKEIFRPDSILLPTSYLQLVQSVQNAQGTKSVLEAFNDAMQAAGRRVSVESWPLLATADAAGTGPRAVSYVRDAEMAGLIIPALFLPQPPQAKGLRWQIPCEGVCGGAAVRAPLSMYYRDGLNG
jgi:hypothetical protein